ncbi:hypothetical protein FB45DRAFT_1065351 [Roridomyces roridus]|uniref:Uncharacterized protein n=1 Tax=Roridomyces roridus TaxID=1738132 RepID=A0AAD7FAM9_9AGAR|nr:hypothetical protein FB45DRAFT_1065351 [Roridomyces roridus]
MHATAGEPGANFNAEGNKLFKAGDYTGALEFFARAVAASDQIAPYFSNLSVANLKLGKNHAAQEVARRALLLEPRSSKARYRRAMARKTLNLIPEALIDITALLTADPSSSQARAEFAVLVDLQSKTGRRVLEPNQILSADSPHAYGSAHNPPRANIATDLHQRSSVPFFFKVDGVPTNFVTSSEVQVREFVGSRGHRVIPLPSRCLATVSDEFF